MSKIGRWLRFAVLAPGAMLLWSCTAPVFPVPPPAAVTFIPATYTDSTGTQQTLWTTQGAPLDQAANAVYYVYNRRLTSGVFTTANADGSFVAPPMTGNVGDQILVYYRTPTGDSSDSACLLLDSSPRFCP